MQRIKTEWNYIMQCGLCPDRSRCIYKDKVKDDNYCLFELDIYRRFKDSLDQNYTLIPAHWLLVEQVIWDMIIRQRISRRLKFDGLDEDVEIEDPDGRIKRFKKEHILKQGMHLDMVRILRMLRELKLTPKEASPKQSKVIHEFKDGISDELKKVLKSTKSKTT